MKTRFFSKVMLIVALSVCGAVAASAQNFSVEATAGVGFSNYKAGILEEGGTGFRVGAIGELQIPKIKGLYGNAGLLLSLENLTYEDADGYGNSMNPYFLNIPIHVGYSYRFLDKLSAFAEFGPYIGIGLGGNAKYNSFDYDEETGEEFTTKEKYPLFKADEEGYWFMKRMQFGLGIKVGIVAYEHFKLSFGWDWDLLKPFVSTDGFGTSANKHNNGYLSLSYIF